MTTALILGAVAALLLLAALVLEVIVLVAAARESTRRLLLALFVPGYALWFAFRAASLPRRRQLGVGLLTAIALGTGLAILAAGLARDALLATTPPPTLDAPGTPPETSQGMKEYEQKVQGLEDLDNLQLPGKPPAGR